MNAYTKIRVVKYKYHRWTKYAEFGNWSICNGLNSCHSYGYVSPSFGSNINAVTANIIKTTPPTIVTIKMQTHNILFHDFIHHLFILQNLPVRTDIFWAMKRPPITANPVHKECPKTPPSATP